MAFGDLNRINTNLQSMEAKFSLDRINRDLGETQLRLSTGLQINRAEDDAAGFSIASRLGARIEGLEQGLQNTGDAKSVLDIAEASFDSIIDILTEMKVKATHAANDSLGSDERDFIQQQIDALAEEIDDIVDQTEFQGENLLDGEYNASFQVGERVEDVINVVIQQDNENGFASEDLGVDDLEVDDHENAQSAIEATDEAITTVSAAVNQLGINQAQLTIREEILTQSVNSNQAARSRIQDADFAAEQSEALKLQILQQTATSALAQANSAPEAVLDFITINGNGNGNDNGNGNNG